MEKHDYVDDGGVCGFAGLDGNKCGLGEDYPIHIPAPPKPCNCPECSGGSYIGTLEGQPEGVPHQNCTCPLCMPHLWEAGIKGAGHPQTAGEPESVSDATLDLIAMDMRWNRPGEIAGSMARELRTLRAQVAKMTEVLADSNAVYANILRGTINLSKGNARAYCGAHSGIAELRAQLADRDNHIATAYAALGDVNRSIYLFDHIRKLKEQLAERDAAIEKARRDALSVPRWRIMELGSVNFLMERWGSGDWVKYDDVRRALAAQKKEGCEHKWICRLDQQQCMEDCKGNHDLVCAKCGISLLPAAKAQKKEG